MVGEKLRINPSEIRGIPHFMHVVLGVPFNSKRSLITPTIGSNSASPILNKRRTTPTKAGVRK